MEDSHNPMEGKLSKAILVKNDDVISDGKNSLVQSKPGHLESNFDRQLFNLMKEVSTWKKLANFGAVVPSYSDDVTVVHKEPLRVLREYVMLAVRDYN
jgi:Dynein heavy chain, N-terminal region 1